MSTQTFFDKLVGRKREREQAVLSSYKQLVEAITNETEPDPDEVERLLAESGKTLDDLQADCAKLSRRIRLKASLDRRPTLEEERAKLDEQIAAADRVLEEAEANHDEVTRPLYARRQGIDDALREASKAESDLVRECENEDLKRELNDINAELLRLSNDHRELLDQASQLDQLAAAEHARAERQLDVNLAKQYRDKAEVLEKDAKDRRRQAKRVEKRRDDLEKRREELENQMREV
jgi:hypothetical protein